MKKLLFALVLGLLLVAALATVVMADNGPHGSFAANTDACANCHRVHTATYTSGQGSLLIMDEESLCLSCHGTAGTGAQTNVEDGVYRSGSEGTAGRSLLAGGFTNALMATTWCGSATCAPATYDATSKATTSEHTLGAVGTIWGSGANGSGNGGSMVLECTSCHNPHGGAGYVNTGSTSTGWLANTCDPNNAAAFPCTTKAATYRLLRWNPGDAALPSSFTTVGSSVNWSGGLFPTNGSTASTSNNPYGWTVPDNYATNGTEWYTIGTTSAFAAGDYMAGSANNVYNVTGHSNVSSGINVAFFCAQCHDRYFNNSKLRNTEDYSAYCYGATTMPVYSSTTPFGAYNSVSNPTSLAQTSTVDATYCISKASTSSTTGYLWGDSRPSGDATFMYRHASGDIRTSADGTSAQGAGTSLSRACSACHVSHGTTADATTTSGGTIGNDPLAGDSALLRMDGRSQCARCHGFTVVAVP